MPYKIILLLMVCVGGPAFAATPDVDKILTSGKLEDGIVELQTYLQDHPKDDVARLGLGAVQFLRSAERLTQKLAVYGPQTRGIPELQELVPASPAPPELLTYPLVRKLTQEWVSDLAQVDETLSKIDDEQVKLSLHVGRIPMNLAGGGARSLTLLPLLRTFQIGTPGKEADFVIAFDRADVDWLRGYCHILQGLGEIGMAYDGQGLFDVFAHRLFKHVKTPHEFLLEPNRDQRGGLFSLEELSDIIAAVHMFRFPLVEPKRMTAALEHFEQALPMSRQMWTRVLAETDNDHEWIPSPRQTGALNIAVTQEMVDTWLTVVGEAEAVLQGKKLLPFWRGKVTRGINLRRVFQEPTQLDLVLWVQGTAATPYLEEGDLTRPGTWQDFNNAFGGRLMGFGFWFN